MLRVRAIEVKNYLLDSPTTDSTSPLTEGVRSMPKDDKPRGMAGKRGAAAPKKKTAKKAAKKR